MSRNDDVNRHYGRGRLLEIVEKGLVAAGADPENLSVDDLAPVDEFHSRGREATLELVGMVNPTADDRFVDVGCGLGGTARFLAHNYGCHVSGVDLTDEYVEVARELTDRVGLADHIDVRQGSALELPYDDEAFDFATTEHVQMNVADKQTFYREIARVLKPGGRFIFHDIFRGPAPGALRYPLPWAEEESLSHLAPDSEVRSLMKEAGLDIAEWHDRGAESTLFYTQVMERSGTSGPPPLGIHLLMGDNGREKLENYLDNLAGGRLSIVLGMAVREE